MDECRFDNLTRLFGAFKDRRTALKEMVGASAALVSLARADLGLAQDDDVLIEGCRLTGDRCGRNNQCCSNKCNRKRRKKRRRDDRDGDRRNRRKKKNDGQCVCLSNGKKCRKDAACCRGHCDKNERRCRCVPANDTCNKDSDCCRGKCRAAAGGNKFCKAGG